MRKLASYRVRVTLKRALYTILLAVGLSAFVATNSTYAVNILTTATANVGATTILTGAGGLTLTGTPDSIGTLKTFDSVNISTGRQFSGAGIYLDSAGGVETGLGATLKTRLNTVLTSGGYSGTTTNVSALRFQVLVNSNITSVSFNYLFGSREGISDWDVAAILVDNTNFAFLPNGKVIRVNAASGLSRFTASGPFTGIGT